MTQLDLNVMLLEAKAGTLLETAQSLARSTNKARHWSALAILLGRIEDEGMWHLVTPAVSSTRAYASQVLEMGAPEYFETMSLWKMMKLDRTVTASEWAKLSRSRATLVKRVVLGVGGDPREWYEKALVRTPEDLRRLVDERLGKEPWTTVKVPCSVLVADLFDEAMRRALPDVTGSISPDPEQIRDRAVRAACFERIIAYYIGTYEPEGEPWKGNS